jgi:hypothetical protein
VHGQLRPADAREAEAISDTFRGPAHRDLASYAISLRRHSTNPRVVAGMLDAYGWDHEQELAPFIAAHHVYDEIWQMYDRQRHHSHQPPGEPAPSGEL